MTTSSTAQCAPIEISRSISGADKVNVVGWCVGGTILSSALAILRTPGDESVASVTMKILGLSLALLLFAGGIWACVGGAGGPLSQNKGAWVSHANR